MERQTQWCQKRTLKNISIPCCWLIALQMQWAQRSIRQIFEDKALEAKRATTSKDQLMDLLKLLRIISSRTSRATVDLVIPMTTRSIICASRRGLAMQKPVTVNRIGASIRQPHLQGQRLLVSTWTSILASSLLGQEDPLSTWLTLRLRHSNITTTSASLFRVSSQAVLTIQISRMKNRK